MSIKQVKCDSGLTGWRTSLRENYDNDFESFVSWAETYGLVERLGFDSAQEAWDANPMIQGSVNPSDFRVVTDDEIAAEAA